MTLRSFCLFKIANNNSCDKIRIISNTPMYIYDCGIFTKRSNLLLQKQSKNMKHKDLNHPR